MGLNGSLPHTHPPPEWVTLIPTRNGSFSSLPPEWVSAAHSMDSSPAHRVRLIHTHRQRLRPGVRPPHVVQDWRAPPSNVVQDRTAPPPHALPAVQDWNANGPLCGRGKGPQCAIGTSLSEEGETRPQWGRRTGLTRTRDQRGWGTGVPSEVGGRGVTSEEGGRSSPERVTSDRSPASS